MDVVALKTMEELRPAVELFTAVWGRNEDGVPIPGEMLRSLVHAEGLVSGALDDEGALIGAAVAGRAGPGRCYGYIAAALPGRADRGIGFALKQHQRAWALAAGLHTMEWTFDPLVRRNAAFNLGKLGAEVRHYEAGFYGEMHDDQNHGEVGDRLVAQWRLDSTRAERAAAGDPVLAPPPPNRARVLREGPDDAACLIEQGTRRWLRVPGDILAVRRDQPAAARQWREVTRDGFLESFGAGFVGDGVADGWYHLRRAQEEER